MYSNLWTVTTTSWKQSPCYIVPITLCSINFPVVSCCSHLFLPITYFPSLWEVVLVWFTSRSTSSMLDFLLPPRWTTIFTTTSFTTTSSPSWTAQYPFPRPPTMTCLWNLWLIWYLNWTSSLVILACTPGLQDSVFPGQQHYADYYRQWEMHNPTPTPELKYNRGYMTRINHNPDTAKSTVLTQQMRNILLIQEIKPEIKGE